MKVYFFLPCARALPVISRSCRSWFEQWSPDPPVLCDRSPEPSARDLESFGRPNALSGDPRRTKQDTTHLEQPWRLGH